MAPVEPRFITSEDYVDQRRREDIHIANEFRAQRSLIESVRDEVENGLTSVRDELRGELQDVRNELKEGLTSLRDELRGELQDLRNELKEEFGELREEFGELKEELGELKEDLGEVKARLNQMDGRNHNQSRRLPHHDLASIGIYQPNSGFQTPTYFPASVKEFWKLQSPRHYLRLLYLIQFYDIQGYQYWGSEEDYFSETGSSDESDSLSKQHKSIEEAIRNHPRVALEELASRIGLVFQDISEFYRRADEYRQRPQLAVTKRGTTDAGKEAEKHPKVSLGSLLAELPARAARAARVPSESSGERLLYGDVSSDERRHAALIAKVRQTRASSGKSSSEDSPTEAIPSQEMRQALEGIGKASAK